MQTWLIIIIAIIIALIAAWVWKRYKTASNIVPSIDPGIGPQILTNADPDNNGTCPNSCS